jgi:hypothetical protein
MKLDKIKEIDSLVSIRKNGMVLFEKIKTNIRIDNSGFSGLMKPYMVFFPFY